MKTYESLRETFPVFYYKNYTAVDTDTELQVTYHFEVPGLSDFDPVWRFPKKDAAPLCVEENRTLQEMLFGLGMVELVSYWKIACPPKVIVSAGALCEEQIRWWKDLYFLGLGEFFYTNGIPADPDSFMELSSHAGAPSGADMPCLAQEGCLIPIGGGKDSACTIEMLKKSGHTLKTYIINPRGATLKTVRAAGLSMDDSLHARRTLDPRMLALNREGYLNGHTPFSALVAFSSLITAYLHGLKYIALSNESSANESTVAGSLVNHQYSKSFKFEQDFHDYEKAYIRSGIHYFSMLRPLSEFQIAAYFAKQTAYHDIFRSCNAGSKQDIWCGHCPKCLFVFLILSPFLSHERLTEIFGTDMLNDPSMQDDFEKLLGLQDEKPFECVGSRDEVNTAVCLTIERMEQDGEALPKLLSWYRAQTVYETAFPNRHAYDSHYDSTHLLPEEFLPILADACYGGKLPC
ncbi:MAG: hypothetical protein KH452_08390 [Clostridiales bacterium]|nr:hypothetical protein [Clostridiales bacterium]